MAPIHSKCRLNGCQSSGVVFRSPRIQIDLQSIENSSPEENGSFRGWTTGSYTRTASLQVVAGVISRQQFFSRYRLLWKVLHPARISPRCSLCPYTLLRSSPKFYLQISRNFPARVGNRNLGNRTPGKPRVAWLKHTLPSTHVIPGSQKSPWKYGVGSCVGLKL